MLSAPSAGIRAATVPSAPGAPSKISASTTDIQILWSAPTYNGGNAITTYNVFYATSSTGPFSLFGSTSSASVLTMDVTGLTIGTLYYLTVSATNLIGVGAQSAHTAILAATVPATPAAPIVSSQAASAITISWTAPNSMGSTVTDYQVLMCIGTSPTCSYSTIATTTNGAT